jgi:hypothetical protein
MTGVLKPQISSAIHWLDASVEGSLTVIDGKVSSWADARGIGAAWSQSSAISRPTRVVDGVKFVGSTNTTTQNDMQFMSRAGALLSDTIDTWIFIVVDEGQNGCLFADYGSVFQYTYITLTDVQIRYSGYYTLGFPGVSLGSRQLYAVRFAQNQLNTAIDGAAVVSGSAPNGYANGSGLLGSFRIPSSTTPSGGLNAIIREFIVVQSSLTNEEYEEIAFYLLAKWGINGALAATEISGQVKDLQTLQPPFVTLFDWNDATTFVRMEADAQGRWDAIIRQGSQYGAYYLSRDNRCPPIIHGPYTAE